MNREDRIRKLDNIIKNIDTALEQKNLKELLINRKYKLKKVYKGVKIWKL